MKRRPYVGVIGRPDATAVTLHDRTRDRESHAQPIGLGGKELLEEVIELLRRDSLAGITNRDDAARVTPRPGPNDETAVERGRIGHRLERVHHEIEQHLLELDD